MNDSGLPAISDVMRRAAEIQRERGHCKGIIEDDEGRVCAAGALRAALDELAVAWMTQESLPYYNALRDAVFAIDPTASDIPGWNDRPGREGVEVEKAFLIAADRADFPGGQS